MSHCLIVGGTGMLFEVSRRLAYEYDTVSVIGRNPRRFEALRRETIHLKGNLDPLILDYTDDEKLTTEIEQSIERYGDISLVVSWIHSNAPNGGSIIARILNSKNKDFRYFNILGSSSADPSKDVIAPEYSKLSHIKYRDIILGFKIENDVSRWLMDEEISEGVLKAVNEDNAHSIIGVVEPWEKRP